MTKALFILLLSTPALAFDPFEIQIYDGTADAPCHFGLEAHLNRHHDETHLTFEPSFGVTRFWELGGYLQTAQGRYEGVKLRTKFVTPEGTFEHLRLGLNFEAALEPGARWGGEIRPIFAWENHRFLFAANPNVSFPAAFEPGAMAKVKAGPVAFGLEYYGTFPGNENYLFGAIDLISVDRLELNLGIGEGSALVGKLIVGFAF
ncbi:MAG: hypothetical protein ACXWLM_05600 [Myxococcales bacterium]